MYIRSTILLLLFPILAHTQTDKLIGRKDIIWAARVEAIAGFDLLQDKLAPKALEAIPLKMAQSQPAAPRKRPFAATLLQMMEQGALPAFADRGLQQPLSPAEARERMVKKDTIVVFDPETYEEKVHVVAQELLGSTPFFLTQQLWLYDGSKNELETIALAIAPAVENSNQPGEYRPLLWYKLPPPRSNLSRLKPAAVQFATYLSYDVSEEQIEVLKGEEKHLKEILIERLKAGRLTGYDQKRQPIRPSATGELFTQQDTIITFDPETYEENVQVVRLEFSPVDITDFRIQQNWYFAPGRNHLQCRALAVGPAIPIIDEYGTELALRPLFFWRKE